MLPSAGQRTVNRQPRVRKCRSPRVGTVGRPGAPHIGYPEPRDCSPVLLPITAGWLMRRSVGRFGSSGFHPQAAWPGRKVHQCGCYGSDRVADRPSALHTEAPRRRGWGTRLAPTARVSEVTSRIVERLSPCLRRRSPRKLPPGPVTQAWLGRWVLTLPCATWANLSPPESHASADVSSG